MIPAIKHKLPQIRALCQKHKIKKLWIFGSALNPKEFGADSDLDFLYEFIPIESGREYLDHYYGMIQDLSVLLGRNIDFIENKPFRNPYFRQEVESNKLLIYEHICEDLPGMQAEVRELLDTDW